MTNNSQFLFFYIDELIKHHWVDWLEGPLSEVPPEEHRGIRGFQGVVGDTGAGPRTRAGEAYQLGILSGRIVRPQVAGASFPSGWQAVIDGSVPSTKLGFYSYVIGRALRENPNDPNLVRALDCLASIFILHIGFQVDGRWFNTALIFQFANNQLANHLGRILTDDEVRYLAAAVINTLDSDERNILLDPYIADQPIDRLRFDLSNGQIVHFDLNELPDIAAEKRFGVNDFEKTKAALFWANPSRGIFTRAARSRGSRLLQELIKVDQQLAQQGTRNLLEETLNAIQNNNDNPGIFSIAEKAFADFPGLLREWQDLEAELFDATNKAVEAVELDTAPPIWIASQHEIRGMAAADSTAYELEAEEEASEEEKEVLVAGEEAPAPGKGAKKKSKKQLELPSEEALQDLIERELDEISEEAPVASSTPETARKKGKPRATQINFAEKEARNRKLGEAGESFIYRYEIQKLIRAGKEELAKRVKWVSKELGDGLGYDVRSFDLDGSEIFLEVKTTTSGRATPFFVSNNEVAVSEEKGKAYRLVRVFNFPDKPRFFTLSGCLSDVLQLEATSYRARVL
ncbi:DUF3883 domain-containing protein [uncultured Aliiroseovarius sp.]|uniref:DUF3883 domain-containing protein n=1 Tax=uncultured Aliiroseovarius sp. TaxID=1658783 RepID=UPI00262480B7|nr:DUF3883 domain-containing protein [uncultured Aliiroseovarius sp.]